MVTVFAVCVQANVAPAGLNCQINPYQRQVNEQIEKLKSPSETQRAGAAEALGYLRAYDAADAISQALTDPSSLVRREAAMSLGWCGSRRHIEPLVDTLADRDWVVAQAACTALNNLTGMEFAFDALAGPETKSSQIRKWRTWQRALKQTCPWDIMQLVNSGDDEKRLRGIRALGLLGGQDAGDAAWQVLSGIIRQEYDKLSDLQKHLAHACIRTIGRLRQPEGFDMLVEVFATDDWARYAAEAFGDYGDRRAVAIMIEAYPKFARPLDNRMANPEAGPADDMRTGNNTQDRMLETPYLIMLALARLELDNPGDLAKLRTIVPHLVANLPSDWDGGMFYEVEADQLLMSWLLEKCQKRQAVCDTAFRSARHPEKWLQQSQNKFEPEELSVQQLLDKLSIGLMGDVPYMAAWLPAFCSRADVPRLLKTLEHENGWMRINAAKTLMFLDVKEAIEPIAKLLRESHPEAMYGYSGALEHAEYNDPAPRWREAYIRALGRLGAENHASLLADILEDDRNVLDIQYAAALALDELDTPEAVTTLRRAESDQPFHSVRMIAREALWRRQQLRPGPAIARTADLPGPKEHLTDKPKPEALVFIKGSKTVRSDFNGQAGVDPWRQTYSITNSGPTMRTGRNLYTLRPAAADGQVAPLTNFKTGFVADCEVSWDGKKIIFARRLNDEFGNYKQVRYEKAVLKKPGEPLTGDDDPWWHVWEINVDGTGLRQITFGPFHDVMPTYLPDGRIVFSSTRIGTRDEYHGFACTGLTVMNPDGSDIHPIGFNLGSDRDPAILEDGRIVFSRVDIFYSRLKTEVTVQSVFPDGTRNLAVYGPERRAFWIDVHKANAAWTMRPGYQGNPDNRNRVLRLSQAQPLGNGSIICASSGGLVVAGPGPNTERLVPHDRKWAVTSPFPLGKDRILCAATVKQFKIDDRIVTAGSPEFLTLEKGPDLFQSAVNIDLALYSMDINTGEMELIYNDPESADFEARPIMPRNRPVVLAEDPASRKNSYTMKLFCNSARFSRIDRVSSRGKLIRIIEGRPVVSRHQTQQNSPTNRWKNHGGTHARILGTIPLAADGSFFVEVPADRLIHLQVLDSDRRVLGNQTFWMYARPGETRSCIGCHEQRDGATLPNHIAPTVKRDPVKVLPTGGEFSYMAKSWIKGWAPDEIEERTRTVHAINLIARH